MPWRPDVVELGHFHNFRSSDLDLGSGHMAYLCITHQCLPTSQIAFKLEKLCPQNIKDGRTGFIKVTSEESTCASSGKLDPTGLGKL